MSIGCIICSELFQSSSSSEDNAVVLVTCGHTFHESCIINWFKISPTCPICRNPARSETIRLNLQSVSDLNTSQLIQNFKEETSVNKKAFEELKKKFDESVKKKDECIEQLRKDIKIMAKRLDKAEKNSAQSSKKLEKPSSLRISFVDLTGS